MRLKNKVLTLNLIILILSFGGVLGIVSCANSLQVDKGSIAIRLPNVPTKDSYVANATPSDPANDPLANQITSFRITLVGPHGEQTITAKTGEDITINDLFPGDYTVTVDAFNLTEKVHSGTTTVTVKPNQTAQAKIQLKKLLQLTLTELQIEKKNSLLPISLNLGDSVDVVRENIKITPHWSRDGLPEGVNLPTELPEGYGITFIATKEQISSEYVTLENLKKIKDEHSKITPDTKNIYALCTYTEKGQEKVMLSNQLEKLTGENVPTINFNIMTKIKDFETGTDLPATVLCASNFIELSVAVTEANTLSGMLYPEGRECSPFAIYMMPSDESSETTIEMASALEVKSALVILPYEDTDKITFKRGKLLSGGTYTGEFFKIACKEKDWSRQYSLTMSGTNSKPIILDGGSSESSPIIANSAMIDILSEGDYGGWVKLEYTTLQNNNNTSIDADGVNKAAGAILQQAGSTHCRNTIFANNSATIGGAIRVVKGECTLHGGNNFDSNNAKEKGGAIFFANGKLICKSSEETFTKNTQGENQSAINNDVYMDKENGILSLYATPTLNLFVGDDGNEDLYPSFVFMNTLSKPDTPTITASANFATIAGKEANSKNYLAFLNKEWEQTVANSLSNVNITDYISFATSEYEVTLDTDKYKVSKAD